MSDIQDAVSFGAKIAATPLGRRKVMGSMAALTAAATLGAPAFAASDAGLKTFKGRYAIQGGAVINGYFAAPKGKAKLDVVLVMPGAESIAARTEATVRRHAQAGAFAIAPDLAATYAGTFATREAMVADMMAQMPNLKRLARGNGTVRVVTA